MSDAKKKSSGGMPNGAKGGGKPGKFRETLNHILRLVKEIDPNQEGIDEYDRVLEDRDSLKKLLSEKDSQNKKTIDAKTAEIEELNAQLQQERARKEVLFEEFEARFEDQKNHTNRADQLEAEVTQLKNDNQTLKQQERDTRKEHEKLKMKFEQAQADLERKTQQLNDEALNSERLHYQHELLQSNYKIALRNLGDGLLSDAGAPRMSGPLEELATRCHNLVIKYFKEPGAERPIQCDQIRKILGSDSVQLLLRPPFQSAAGRLVICAVAEAVIAKMITDEIFVDIFSPEGMRDFQRGATAVLNFLERVDVSKQNIVRAQLIAAQDPINGRIGDLSTFDEELSHSTAMTCYNAVLPLIGDASHGVPFFTGLCAVFDDAIRLWRPLQRNTVRVMSNADPDESWRWYKVFDVVPDSINASIDPTRSVAKRPILPLFPEVVVGDDIIFPGIALLSQQPAVVIAIIEKDKAAMGNSSFVRQRRMSKGPGAAPTSPSSVSGSAFTTSSQSRDNQNQPKGAGARVHLQKAPKTGGPARDGAS